ncbi:c-type cytochrome [Ponticoccus sp. SC2-23]|uniref:c-type cytochrome n=1 Tax=Alexandriicola marinus TaxID=2081710 RepID=UPI000FD851DD|nr:c-type cytochrome [Alexandriicola marinus]MBM1219647.1 c-type cytochrome [Ponticoccus sp. SC6-9]MBM1223281.1 c-type cytochrome [Ponticoccus sp. SC6-15]MBM1229460.1 c-type cytochrome [Ponticoccus sp. SC6-38]MBM1232247.1 c-type cytochrome [Ponticoccus sp. SC6-45]MBM1237803.1 c-type cytochrome [Ponticoccus sp. SC6-49]MBM1241258.1 c-type cytochrome [Ponticoccus sp. SC2-64]MBM1245771.1 c-type cytochrome [Ponticoccus sp. SC6-42]MBM1250249.1 c-type cytochrome [Ponticoccus sp. SC6-33]MBM1255812
MLVRTFAASLAAAAFIAGPACAQDADTGAAIYLQHCATCHGLDADGKGPMAPALVLQPPDLTALSARNGGRFPYARVIARIDGRDPLVAHGSPMPVYGDFFEGANATIKDEVGHPILTSVPVVDLVAYLEGLQG